jgi:carbon monoxide dehydrogenase subunit G
MANVAVSGSVRAAPEEVFRFLADLENWPRWQSDMKSTKLAEASPGQVSAVYRYLSKAMGMTFDSTVRLVRVDAPREIAFEGQWTGMIRPNGRYLVEPAPEGSRVTLNPRPEVRGIGRIMEPLIAVMGRRLNQEHPEALRKALEKG